MKMKCFRTTWIAQVGILLVMTSLVGAVQAGVRIDVDDTKWLTIGAGIRGSLVGIEDQSPGGDDWSKSARLDNASLFVNGQINPHLKLAVNMWCVFCGNSGAGGGTEEFIVLDAIVKFELSPHLNFWAGRLLVPADRAEMSGAFYSNTYDFNKTPFYAADFSVDFGEGGAGVYGRDQGVVVWGTLPQVNRLQYALGIFNGFESTSSGGPDQHDNFLYAMRLAYSFLETEQNPGYLTSSTYYGAAGDIFTIGLAVQNEKDGVGSMSNPGDFLGLNVDVLFEKVLEGNQVLTIEGEYKTFNADYDVAAFADADCFCMFDGDAWTATALYLFSEKVGIGRLQPYVRYTKNKPDESPSREEKELGLNYIIDGHNAKVALFAQRGDIATKGLNFSPTASGKEVTAIKLGVQVQF